MQLISSFPIFSQNVIILQIRPNEFYLKVIIFRIEIDASDNNNTTALHYAAKYVFSPRTDLELITTKYSSSVK